jgi:hypothetical protein
MADSPDGIRTWPTSPGALADTHACPGCFTTISEPRCPVCGFVVTDPRAARVLSLGRSIIAAETERQRVMQEVRLDYAVAPPAHFTGAQAPAAPVSVAPVSVAPVGPSPTAAPTAPAAPWPIPAGLPPLAASTLTPAELAELPPPSAPAPDLATAPNPAAALGAVPPAQPDAPQGPAREPRPPRRRLSVPVLLLIVGVSLVGVAAVFFLVYAWFTWGIAVRALIIGAITVATIGIASLLRRRTLTATAEAIAVLGVLLLALDAWAVRANDFFGTADMRPALYYGGAALVVGVFCRAWAKLSGLRSPDLAAVLALPVGAGLVIGGATALPSGEALVAGLLGAAAGGLLHALPAPWSSARAREDSVPERVTLANVGVASLVLAAVLSVFLSPDSIAVPLWTGAGVLVIGAAHAVLLRRRNDRPPLPAAPVLAGIASATAALVTAAVGWQLAARTDLPVYPMLVGPVIAVAVPVAIDRVRRRISGLGAAQVATLVLGTLSLGVSVIWWAAAAAMTIASAWTLWRTDVFAAPPDQIDGAFFAAVSGALLVGILTLSPTLGRRGLADARFAVAGVVLLVGVAVPAIPSLLVGVAILLAVASVAALTRRGVRLGAGITAGLAASTAFVAGTTAPWLWLGALVVAVAVPVVAFVLVRPTGAGSALLALTPVAVLTLAAFIAPSAIAAVRGTDADPGSAFVLVQWIALAALLAAVVLRLAPAPRSSLAGSAYVLFALSLLPYASDAVGRASGSRAVVGGSSASLGEPAAGIVRAAGLVILLAIIALARTRVRGGTMLGAAALVPAAAAYATFLVLQAFGLADADARALATVGAVVVIVWAGAVRSLRRHSVTGAAPTGDADPGMPAPRFAATRAAVDIGALACVLVLAWEVPADLRGAMLAVIAAGLAGASVVRSWAAPHSTRIAGMPTISAAGAPTAAAARRLLAWPALLFATLGLWSALAESADPASLTVEAYVIAPAVLLAGFAIVLVWLRRHIESAIALTAGLLLGLAVPAVAGWSGSELRGIVVALVASAVCLALTATPLLRVRVAALSGAVAAIAAVALVVLERTLDGTTAQAAWLLLLVGLAFASALGVAARSPRGSIYVVVVPPVVLAVAGVAAVFRADEPVVLGVGLGVLAALHLAASAWGRAPFGAATRWTSIGAAIVLAAAGLWGGAVTIDGVTVIELMSLPVALTLLVGSALAQYRQRRRAAAADTGDGSAPRTDAELGVWLAGLGLALVPSIAADPEPLRVWLGIAIPLAAAVLAAAVPLPGVRAVRTWSAVVLSGGALVMGTRALQEGGFPSAEPAIIVAGAGAIVVALVMTRFAASGAIDTAHPTGASGERTVLTAAAAIAAAGTVLLLATVIMLSDGAPWRTLVTVGAAALIAVGGAALLPSGRWRSLGAVLAIGGVSVALASIATRLIVVSPEAGSSIEPDGWAAAGLLITVLVGGVALRRTRGTELSAAVAQAVGVAASVGVLFFAGVEASLLGASAGAEWRAVVTMSVLTLAGVAGVLLRTRLGRVLPVAAAVGATLFGAIALVWFGVRPVELITAPVAIGLVALGVRALRRDPKTRSWPALGPGLGLLTLPSLAYDLGEAELWRVVGLGVVAVAMVVVGAIRRLQAPLVLGSIVLLIHAAAQLWPWISNAYEYVPWWLWLGLGGALLIFLAARYEKNVRAVRASFTAVASLR